MKRRFLKSYGRLAYSYSEVMTPASVEELKALLLKASSEKRKVTFRAGGSSFDTQALNHDLVISLEKLNKIIDIDTKKKQITVEAGTRWEDILLQLRPKGLTPFVVVTTAEATAGGTLSGNCLSRSSPTVGKEGKHIARFKLLKPNGELIECTRRKNAKLFRAVIGGFGYLGVVTEITYDLLDVGPRTQMQTVANKFESFDDLLAALTHYTKEPQDWNAIYSVAFFSGKKNKGFVFRSKYTDETKLRRIFIHRPKNLFRIPVEFLIQSTALNTLFYNLTFKFFIKENDAYVDELSGYTFFMDGNRRAKKVAAFFGIDLTALQQTYVVPEAGVRDFLHRAANLLRRNRLTPNLFDVLFVPEDDILMSSNNGLAGFAVSLAFENVSKRKGAKLDYILKALNDVCHQMGGRVYLVKNVRATPEQITAMYGENLQAFQTLKRELDPDNILRNEFFDRLFTACPASPDGPPA
ncbi:MAG: FAD-binding oxidoreductase [Calditrichaeota bacterium]|nr:MAG: FAD-binding oxidoreductase [Calditrichota bacterium]